MKSFIGVVSLLLLTSPSVVSAQAFEGAITIRMIGGRRGAPSQDVEYLSRNGNVRVNIASPAGAMSILGIAAESKTYMLVESQRMYMEVPTGDAAAAASKAAGDVKISKTGRTETIAGLSCEHVIVETNGTSGPQKADVCMTQGLGNFVNPMGNLAGPTPDWQRQLAKDGGFPLRVTLGDGSIPLEVTKVEKKRVSDELFRIPADYAKMDMPRRP